MLQEQVETSVITLTPSAANAVRELLAKRNLTGYALRVYISGGGCSGFQYGMALDASQRETDHQYEYDGIQLWIDEVSYEYLQGATIDYVDEIMGSGFKITNPNAVSSCGCGSSFRTKDSSSEASDAGEAGGCSSCH